MGVYRGADLVAGTLQRLGVSRVFTLSGNHIMPIFDALLSTRIEVVHVRQEAACVHMADAWGRLTGEVGVALVTGGQGHANATAALFTALAGESPVLLLSGHAGLGELGRGAFQEMDQAGLARPVTKASWVAGAAATLGWDVMRAMRIALSGRPGPVHLSLPVDLLEQEVASDHLTWPTAEDLQPEIRVPAPALIEATALRIEAAERPLVLCGPAQCTERGRSAMRILADAAGLPVIGLESPRGVNDPSLGAFAEILAEADLVVLIGKPLDFTLKFGDAPALSPRCTFVVLDPDPALLDRVAQSKGERLVGFGIADSSAAIAALAECFAGSGRRPPAWRERVREALAFAPPDWSEARAQTPDRLHPAEMCRAIDGFLAGYPRATLVCDGGEIGQWAQALVRTDCRLINGVSGTIGVSLPFAIAARAATPGEPALAVMGDGTFGFHMAEFDTALRHGLPVIVVVGNDARWNAEYQIQLRQYGSERARFCDLLPTRYDQVATALGGFGALVTSAADLPDALARAQASGLPACINVMIEGSPAPTIRRRTG